MPSSETDISGNDSMFKAALTTGTIQEHKSPSLPKIEKVVTRAPENAE